MLCLPEAGPVGQSKLPFSAELYSVVEPVILPEL